MTRQQLIASHGEKLSAMISSTEFSALLNYARTNCPFIGNHPRNDPTLIVNNEGSMQGYFAALKVLSEAAITPTEPVKFSGNNYQPPEPRKPDSQ